MPPIVLIVIATALMIVGADPPGRGRWSGICLISARSQLISRRAWQRRTRHEPR
jgi:hypothetical protein